MRIQGREAVFVPTASGIGIAVCGESGYHPLDLGGPIPYDKAVDLADRKNKEAHIDPELVEAIHVGSMFGWHVPGAMYKGEFQRNGQYKNPNAVTA